jgi:hypothetical protein
VWKIEGSQKSEARRGVSFSMVVCYRDHRCRLPGFRDHGEDYQSSGWQGARQQGVGETENALLDGRLVGNREAGRMIA